MAAVKKISQNAQAFETLKRDIIACDLKPSATITEAWLTERYPYGKAAIRHSLARLTQQGLAVNHGRLGYTVAPITIKGIRESYQIRRLVEPELCRLAAGKLSADTLSRLQLFSRATYDLQIPSEVIEYSYANHHFHCLIAHAAGNHRLARLIEELSEDHMRIAYVSMVYGQRDGRWSEEHARIVNALEANQGEEAAQLMNNHLTRGEKAIMHAVLELPDLIETSLS